MKSKEGATLLAQGSEPRLLFRTAAHHDVLVPRLDLRNALRQSRMREGSREKNTTKKKECSPLDALGSKNGPNLMALHGQKNCSQCAHQPAQQKEGLVADLDAQRRFIFHDGHLLHWRQL